MKKTFKRIKSILIKEFILIVINVIFNGIVNYTSQYFAKQSKMIKKAGAPKKSKITY